MAKKEKDIFIRSVGCRITMDCFKERMYKKGHAYKINDSYFHRCIGYKDSGTPVVDSISILDDVNGGNTQIIYTASALPIPSLDFVNDVMCGKITEIDPVAYENLLLGVKNIAQSLKAMMKYAER